MNRALRAARTAGALLWLATAPVRAQTGKPALGGLDPVALCAGETLPGRAEFAADHYGYAYCFASEQHRATFVQDPERFCIQLGGACARMGPLSGKGDPDRFHVHDRRIYIFASDECRESFRKEPARFLPRRATAIDGEPDALRAGSAACARAIEHLGGAARLAALRNVQWRRTWTTTIATGPRRDGCLETIELPDRARCDQHCGDDYRFATIAAGNDGFCLGTDGNVHDLHATGVAEFRQDLLRRPVVLLRQLAAPDCRAVRIAAATVDGRACDLVRVGWRDVATTLAIAGDDGAVLQQRTQTRGPQLWFGELTETFADFRTVGGVSMPHRVTAVFDGGAPTVVQWDAIAVDLDLPKGCFDRQ